MASPWLVLLPLGGCGLFLSAWFRKAARAAYESATCMHVAGTCRHPGETAEEQALHRQALRRSLVGVGAIVAVVAGVALDAGSQAMRGTLAFAVFSMKPSPGRLAFYAVATGLILRSLVAECVQKSLDGDGHLPVIVRRLGYPAYWTVQTLTMLLVLFGLSLAGEAALLAGALPPGGLAPALLVAAPHRLAVVATTQAAMVTLLFTCTMWGSDTWRRKYITELEEQGVPYGVLELWAHYTMWVAVPDLLVVRRPNVLQTLSPGLGSCAQIVTAYTCLFGGLLVATKALTGRVQYSVIAGMMTLRMFPLILLGVAALQCLVASALCLAVEYTL